MDNEINYHGEQSAESQCEMTGAAESPFCGSLRSKKFFMMDRLASEAAHYLDASNHCWCRETQQVMGPDGSRVNPARCVPGRTCYVSALES